MQQIAPVANGAMTSDTTGYVSDLDTPLLMFSERDIWTLRDAAEGVLITGGIGSGKSSGSGAAIFKSYLSLIQNIHRRHQTYQVPSF